SQNKTGRVELTNWKWIAFVFISATVIMILGIENVWQKPLSLIEGGRIARNGWPNSPECAVLSSLPRLCLQGALAPLV
ncbi:MAG: hypothetical protein M1548_07755, partial [Actinobacteria bacterium]|nr:hypothetical protein [Actinomycetota bacterium]